MTAPAEFDWQAVKMAAAANGKVRVDHVEPRHRADLAIEAGKHGLKVRVVDRTTLQIEV